jgi:hypothetical protein
MQTPARGLCGRPSHVRTGVRLLAAILLLFVGADHYREYSVSMYSVLPTIGTLFLLNFIAATVLGTLLLVPLERLFHRFGGTGVVLAAAGGFGIAATSLIALLVSEQTPLFGFMELNYRPEIVVALASEAAAAASLGLLLVLTLRARRAAGRRPLGTSGIDHLRPSTGAM